MCFIKFLVVEVIARKFVSTGIVAEEVGTFCRERTSGKRVAMFIRLKRNEFCLDVLTNGEVLCGGGSGNKSVRHFIHGVSEQTYFIATCYGNILSVQFFFVFRIPNHCDVCRKFSNWFYDDCCNKK